MSRRLAYMPLDTHPQAAPDAAILAAFEQAEALGFSVTATVFAVNIPPAGMPGGYVVGVEAMARVIEERSTADCARIRALVERTGAPGTGHSVATRRVVMGAALEAAATEARYFDLSVLPWTEGSAQVQDMAQALVFGSGRPVLLVPAASRPAPLSHIAIAWDESRVAARALGDALQLLARGGRVSVLTVGDEKALRDARLSESLAASLAHRGYEAEAVDLALGGRTVAKALLEGAHAQGAQVLAMGGFGHSRLRDFILGSATRSILSEPVLPVLLSH
jgi:nucleotide-binding universal stress UspA family protein